MSFRDLLFAGGGAPMLSLPTTNYFAGWEARSATLVSGDVDTIPDATGNGRDMAYDTTRPTVSSVGGHTAMRLGPGHMTGVASTSSASDVDKTYYFVGSLDAGTYTYRAIIGMTGLHWVGLDSSSNRYVGYNVAAALLKTPPLGSLFQFSMEFNRTTGNVTVRDPAGTEVKAGSVGVTFQKSGVLRLGSTNGAYYPAEGDYIAGYVYHGLYDADVPAYISQEWAGA